MDAEAKRTAKAAAAPTSRERVYVHIREKILRGSFPANSFIEEHMVTSALGVSRTLVREAFHRLQAERFIDLLPRRGALVRQVTAQELTHLYETRRMIEGYAAARICQAHLALPAEMTDALDRMLELGGGDLFVHVDYDRLFHRSMVSALGNTVLTELYDMLRSRQQRVAITALTTRPQRITKILQEHRALVEALQRFDGTAAAAVLEQHLQPVFEVVSLLPGFVGDGNAK
jgi:DNA-binding GntR family transcriptional regulator